MRRDECTVATTLQTSVPPDSTNWNWWAQNAARNADVFSARLALLLSCACRSYPSPDVRAPYLGILGLSGEGISGIPDIGGVDNTLPPPCLVPVPEPQRGWLFHCVCSRGSWSRSAPSSSATRVGCDPRLEFGSFRPRTAPSPAPEDSGTAPPRR